jgi:hypothetical protein
MIFYVYKFLYDIRIQSYSIMILFCLRVNNFYLYTCLATTTHRNNRTNHVSILSDTYYRFVWVHVEILVESNPTKQFLRTDLSRCFLQTSAWNLVISTQASRSLFKHTISILLGQPTISEGSRFGILFLIFHFKCHE